MKKYLALAAAGGALAIGVPAAIAATGAPDTATTTPTTPVQSAAPTATPDQQRPGDDCPFKDGRGPGNGGAGNGGAGQAPSTPYSGTDL